jgi:hypothetical protein
VDAHKWRPGGPKWITRGRVADRDSNSIGSVDPDPDTESGSGSSRTKMTHKTDKSRCFEVLDLFFIAEGFVCNLDVLYGVVMSTISNERTNVLISKLIIGTKAKHFVLVPLLSEQKQNILIWSENCLRQSRTFLFSPKTVIDRSERFWFSSLFIGTKAKRFDLVHLVSERKQNILIW